MKKFAVTLSILLVVPVILAAGLFAYLKTDHAEQQVLKRINQNIPGRITVESLDWSVFPASVSAAGIRVKDRQARTCLEITSLEAFFDPGSILKRTVAIRSISIHQPRVTAIRQKDGSFSLVRALINPKEKPADPEPGSFFETLPQMNLLIPKAELTQGTLTYRDQEQEIAISDIRINLSRFNLHDRSFNILAETGGGTGRINNRRVSISRTKIGASFTPDEGASFDADLESDLLTASVRGKVTSFPENPGIEIKVSSTSNLDIISVFRPDYKGPAGDITLFLEAKGRIDNPEAKISIVMPRGTTAKEDSAGFANVNASLSDKVVTIEKAHADFLNTGFDLNGTIDLSRVFPDGFSAPASNISNISYDLSFSQRNMNLQHLSPWIKGFSGLISSRGTVSGSGVHPDTLEGECRIAVELLNFKTPKLDKAMPETNLSFDAKMENRLLKVGRFSAETVDTKLRGEGSLDTEQMLSRGTLHFKSTDLYSVLSLAGINQVKGSAAGRIDFSGSPMQPVIDTELLAKNLAVRDISMGRVRLDGSLLASGRVDIREMRITRQDSSVLLQGSADLLNRQLGPKEVITGNFVLTGRKIDPKALLKETGLSVNPGNLPSELGFDLAGQLFCDTSEFAFDPDFSKNPIPVKNLKAETNLETMRISMQAEPVAKAEASIFPGNNSYSCSVQLADTLVAPVAASLGVSGIKGKVSGNVQASGVLPWQIPSKSRDTLENSTGRIRLDTAISGTFSRPDFDGAVRMEKVSCPVPGTGMAVSNLNGSISATPDSLTIETLKGNLGKGKVKISGRIKHTGFKPQAAEITLEADRVFIDLPETAGFTFNTNLDFFHSPERSHLSGNIMLVKGEYTGNFTFSPVKAVTRRKRKTLKPFSPPSLSIPGLENTGLDVDIGAKSPLVVNNDTVLAMIEPDMNISGSLSEPLITGRVTIQQGTVTYLGREFEIENGIVDFTDPYAVNPSFDITATASIREWTIFLEISGMRENLKFDLHSEPEQSHRDIVSLLVTGKTASELPGGMQESGSPTAMAADKASEILSERMQKATPLDLFEMEYRDSSGQNDSNVDVTMGKELSRRLEIKYSKKTQEKGPVHEGEAEYKLLENLMLKTFNDSQGNFGGEMTFKLEFR
ncbi:MAG: translocation/assembly module TamB domain-containing protein [Desulfobacteraceae bacterium]